jgi:PAS domain S-box-containing protein
VNTFGAIEVAGQASDIEALLETGADFSSMESLCRDVVEQAPVGIAFVTRDGNYRNCNRSFCAMLGFSADELAGRSVVSLTVADDLESTVAGLARLWRGEVSLLDAEKRYRCKDGGELWVRVSTSLVRGHGAAPACAVKFVRDISARKEIAAALVRNQTLLATVISELPLALLSCDMSGRITHSNRAAVELFGIPDEETTGSGPQSAYPLTSNIYLSDGATPIPREQRPLARALGGENVSDAEFIIVRPDGAVRMALASARRLVGPTGQGLGAVVVVQDITERRRAEEELERVHKQLLVASRYAGMAEIATSILHNVGNVLNSVNVSASLLAERVGKSKCSGLARVASMFAEHAADLPAFLAGARGRQVPAYLQELATVLLAERDATVAELSALRANIEHIKEIVATQQSYARRAGLTEVLDVRALVEDSLSMNDAAFSRHRVAIVREFQDVPPIRVDKHKALQILTNLIRNAGQACDEARTGGEKRVTVRVYATSDAVLVSIIDTGIGIPQENLQRIFNHGFTTRKDGHGFGLHSSALAAKELGGTLHVESAGPGQGATFTLRLPLESPESADGE